MGRRAHGRGAGGGGLGKGKGKGVWDGMGRWDRIRVNWFGLYVWEWDVHERHPHYPYLGQVFCIYFCRGLESFFGALFLHRSYIACMWGCAVQCSAVQYGAVQRMTNLTFF